MKSFRLNKLRLVVKVGAKPYASADLGRPLDRPHPAEATRDSGRRPPTVPAGKYGGI